MISHRRQFRAPVRILAVGGVIALSLTLAACGSDSDSAGGGPGGLPSGDFVLTADNIAFDTNEIPAPADTDFVIVLDNQEAGVQHNINIKDTEFKTDLESGVSAQVLTVNLPAGEYEFICDLHPAMAGTLTAS